MFSPVARLIASLQSSQLPRHYHLAFVSDGSHFQILGIMMVVNQLLHSSPQFMQQCTVWVGLPTDCHQRSAGLFDLFRDRIAVRLFATQPRHNDPYFVKLGLTALCERLAADDALFYLDYDHLVCGALCAKRYPAQGILVSSEVKTLPSSVAFESCAELPAVRQPLRKHYNNSLILGSVARVRKAARVWRRAYQRLPSLRPEQREEIAFCAAAGEAGESLIAAPYDLQEHFRSSSADAVLFHYGGATLVRAS